MAIGVSRTCSTRTFVATAIIAIWSVDAATLEGATGAQGATHSSTSKQQQREIEQEREVATQDAMAEETSLLASEHSSGGALRESAEDGSIDEQISREMEELRALREAARSHAGSTEVAVPQNRSLLRREVEKLHASALVEQAAEKSDAVTSTNATKSSAVPPSNEIPRDIYSSDGYCDEMETDMDDDMLGSSLSFERHAPKCHSDRVLRSWKVSRGGTATRYKIQYTCCMGQHVGECARNQTEWMSAGTGQTNLLKDHSQVCYEKQTSLGHEMWVLGSFHMESRDATVGAAGAKDMRFVYSCCSVVAFGQCTEHETPPQDDGRGHISYLERHAPACQKDWAMARWNLEESAGGQYKVSYRCCPFKPQPTFEELQASMILMG